VCTTGANRCKPGATDTTQTCDANGQWADSGACGGVTPKCVAGQCVTGADGTTQATASLSCKKLLEDGHSTGSGVYWIDPNGAPTSDAFRAYCDMTLDGGGWTVLMKGATLSQVFSTNALGTVGPGDHKLSDAQINAVLAVATEQYNLYLSCGSDVAQAKVTSGWVTNSYISTCQGALYGPFCSGGPHANYFGLSQVSTKNRPDQGLVTMLNPATYGSNYPPCRLHNVGDFPLYYLSR
jgi:hypothetical protein